MPSCAASPSASPTKRQTCTAAQAPNLRVGDLSASFEKQYPAHWIFTPVFPPPGARLAIWPRVWAPALIGMLLSPLLPALQGFSPSLGGFPFQTAEAKASSARYAFNRATWGYLTTIQASLPVAEVASFSDGLANASTGRLWFYMMDASVESSQGYPAAITVSEASYNATCGFDGTLLDPEDPRCAKVRVRVRVRVAVGVGVGVWIRELGTP